MSHEKHLIQFLIGAVQLTEKGEKFGLLLFLPRYGQIEEVQRKLWIVFGKLVKNPLSYPQSYMYRD